MQAQEDAEVLRSLVVPLEEEIKALKDKLRATDEQLQKCRQCGHITELDVIIFTLLPHQKIKKNHHSEIFRLDLHHYHLRHQVINQQWQLIRHLMRR